MSNNLCRYTTLESSAVRWRCQMSRFLVYNFVQPVSSVASEVVDNRTEQRGRTRVSFDGKPATEWILVQFIAGERLWYEVRGGVRRAEDGGTSTWRLQRPRDISYACRPGADSGLLTPYTTIYTHTNWRKSVQIGRIMKYLTWTLIFSVMCAC